MQTFVELSSSIALDKWWHSASRKVNLLHFYCSADKSKLSLTTMKNRFCGQFGRKKGQTGGLIALAGETD